MAQSDAELVQCWRRGDLAAFEALVRRWQQPMARFLFHAAGPRAAVEDLCQETFLRLFCGLGKYQERGSFSTWLYQIAINVARDHARRRPPAAAPSLRDGVELDGLPGRSPSAEGVCQQLETSRAVRAALCALPEALRLVLVLRHYEELSFEQIARLTRSPASTVKSRFAAALARLRVQLEHVGFTAEEPVHELP